MHARTIVHTHTHIHMRMRKAKLAHSMNMRMTLANKTPDQLRTSAALLQLQSEFRKPAAFLYSQDACTHVLLLLLLQLQLLLLRNYATVSY